jgi:hypothetical protein
MTIIDLLFIFFVLASLTPSYSKKMLEAARVRMLRHRGSAA